LNDCVVNDTPILQGHWIWLNSHASSTSHDKQTDTKIRFPYHLPLLTIKFK